MSYLPRLRDDRLSSLERQVLESAKADVPTGAHCERLLAALGLGSVLTASAAAQAGTALSAAANGNVVAGTICAGAVGTGAGATASLGAKAGVAMVVKWVAIGLVAGGASGGAWLAGHVALEHRGASSRATSTVAAPDASRVFPGRGGPSAERAPIAKSPEETLETVGIEASRHSAALASVAPSPPALPETPTTRRSIADELELVDDARRALSSGAAARALTLVEEHARRFPSGAFRPEADLLRCDALLALGHRDEAALVASRFLAEQPSSPHADRMRRLLMKAAPAVHAVPAGSAVPARPGSTSSARSEGSARFPNQ